MSIKEQKAELTALLQDKEYRDAFVEASIAIGVPSQIRELRKQRGWTQKRLADEAKMLQESISRLEDPTKGSVNLKTLLKLASAFDVGLFVRFVPFGDMVDWKLKLSPELLEAVSFDKDPYFTVESEPLPSGNFTKYPIGFASAATNNKVIYLKDRIRRQVAHIPTASSVGDSFNYDTGSTANG